MWLRVLPKCIKFLMQLNKPDQPKYFGSILVKSLTVVCSLYLKAFERYKHDQGPFHFYFFLLQLGSMCLTWKENIIWKDYQCVLKLTISCLLLHNFWQYTLQTHPCNENRVFITGMGCSVLQKVYSSSFKTYHRCLDYQISKQNKVISHFRDCTANILIVENTTFHCVIFPMHFQCPFNYRPKYSGWMVFPLIFLEIFFHIIQTVVRTLKPVYKYF